jgi:hypothetical protein
MALLKRCMMLKSSEYLTACNTASPGGRRYSYLKLKNDPEISLLLLCCRVFLKTEQEEALKKHIQQNKIDWKKVYELSAIHRIRPVVFAILNKVQEQVDRPILEKFHRFCKRFTSIAFSRKLEADRIIDTLHKRNVKTKLYKGVDFALFAYKDIGIREFSDIDIIIKKEDVPAIVIIMKEEGYEMKEKEFYNRFPKEFLRIHKDIVFHKEMASGVGFTFEFHFGPIQYFSTYQKGFAELLGEDYLSAGRQYNNQDYFKLMLINNGVADYFPHLRSVLDLAIIYKNVQETATMKNDPALERFNMLWQFLSFKFFNLPAALNSNNKNSHYINNYLYHKIINKKESRRILYIRYSYLNILFNKGPKEKWHQLLRSAHFLISPNGNDIAALKLPFYYLYYFTKPFRLLFNLFIPKKLAHTAPKA